MAQNILDYFGLPITFDSSTFDTLEKVFLTGNQEFINEILPIWNRIEGLNKEIKDIN